MDSNQILFIEWGEERGRGWEGENMNEGESDSTDDEQQMTEKSC